MERNTHYLVSLSIRLWAGAGPRSRWKLPCPGRGQQAELITSTPRAPRVWKHREADAQTAAGTAAPPPPNQDGCLPRSTGEDARAPSGATDLKANPGGWRAKASGAAGPGGSLVPRHSSLGPRRRKHGLVTLLPWDWPDHTSLNPKLAFHRGEEHKSNKLLRD